MAPFCGVVKSLLHDEVVTWWFFAELNRVSSGALGSRADTATSSVRLRGDGFGSPRLSSCSQSKEKVASLSK
jgi:hypothetical protein